MGELSLSKDRGQHRHAGRVLPPESGVDRRSSSGSDGRLTNQTSDSAGTGEDVGEDGGLGAVVLAVPLG